MMLSLDGVTIFRCALFLDLNECTEDDRGGCAQGCSNNKGGYTCFCGNGYTLNADNKTCDGK